MALHNPRLLSSTFLVLPRLIDGGAGRLLYLVDGRRCSEGRPTVAIIMKYNSVLQNIPAFTHFAHLCRARQVNFATLSPPLDNPDKFLPATAEHL